ncbi:hypothetical protein, partial [Asanoa sp. NPDC050611]|uniref:hypothetical protein n=1 Tax=Asanoa sp. NPDC050611 TaxID=3157098 RepID=UPI0033CC35DD
NPDQLEHDPQPDLADDDRTMGPSAVAGAAFGSPPPPSPEPPEPPPLQAATADATTRAIANPDQRRTRRCGLAISESPFRGQASVL